MKFFAIQEKKNVEINAAMYKNKNIVWILCIMRVFCTKKYKIDLKIEIFLLTYHILVKIFMDGKSKKMLEQFNKKLIMLYR